MRDFLAGILALGQYTLERVGTWLLTSRVALYLMFCAVWFLVGIFGYIAIKGVF